jgi:hypothetical protein
MTLELADGRGELFQWDTGRIIEFGEDAVSQAHFTNTEKVINIPYTVEVKNGKAAIPDELLQVPGTLIVYAWVSDTNGGYTKVQVNFPVFARPKPSDYIYTPTEHAGFDRLRAEIGNLSALQTDAKDNLVTAINEVAQTGSGAEVFYIDLAGNYPNYTCPVAMADIKAAYAAGKVLECRCTRVAYTVTLPLFVPMPAANTWIFSGSGALESMGFDAQSFTVAITANGVAAQGTTLNQMLRISVGPKVYLYDGSVPINVVIDDDSFDAVLYTAQTLTDAQKKQARENIDAAIGDFVINGTVNSANAVTLDKTYDQIKEALNAGRKTYIELVRGVISISVLPVMSVSLQEVVFAGVTSTGGGVVTAVSVVVTSDDNVSLIVSEAPALNSDGAMLQVTMTADPADDMQIATKKYVDDKEFILQSTTPGSSKKFKITVEDSGVLSAVEVTE